MSSWNQFIAVSLFVACLASGYFVLRTKRRPRVLPPPRSKRADDSYQETNDLAKLFVEVLALKDAGARWPAILQRLNPDDDPQIRTLLLELRSCTATDPSSALEAIETVCVASKSQGQNRSRAELLKLAQSVSELVKRT